jgi:hypothetical protein
VFGLLGIVNDTCISHNRLQINYSRSVKDMYIGVVQAVIETTQGLDIICSSRPNAPVSSWNVQYRQPDLPLWIPDWSICSSVHRFNSIGIPFRAAGCSLAQVTFSSKGDILTAKGFCIGSISLYRDMCNLQDPLERTDVWFNLIRYISGWHKALFGLTKDKGSVKDAFFRILYTNFTDFYKRSPNYELFFRELQIICLDLEAFGIVLAYYFIAGISPSKMISYLTLIYRAIGDRCLISFSLDIQNSIEFIPSYSTLASLELMIGLAPNTTQNKDKVCILLGCNVPVII